MVKQINPENIIRVLSANKGCGQSGFLINKITIFLRINGYKLVSKEFDGGNIVLINSCCFTNKTELVTRRLIEKSLSQTAVKKVIIFGCFHYLAKEMVLDDRIIVIGPKELEKFNQIFEHIYPVEQIPTGSLDHRYSTPCIGTTDQDFFVLICQGCEQHCSYCNIKCAKGDVVSCSITDIVKDIQRGIKEGKKDIVLMGDDCGSYGIDLKTDLAVLIKEILCSCSEVRIKINFLFPGHLIRLFPALQESIATDRIIYMNVPIQSGSERVLKLMNRNYDMNRLKENIKEIRKISPSLRIFTHIIVNFPTETRDDFLRTLRVTALFDDFVIFNYSDNARTPASKILPKVDVKERKKRLEICRRITKRTYRGNVSPS